MGDEIVNKQDLIRDLQKYAEIEGSEIGEYCQLLLKLYESYTDYMNPVFIDQLHDEILDQTNHFKRYCRINRVTKQEETVYDELEWFE